jgi:hypothetical protein
MSTETRIAALASAIGADIGDLGSLTTTETSNLVGAINEIVNAANAASGIDDSTTAAGSTWSSNKIVSELAAAISNLATGSPATLDTINEIAAALEDNPDVIQAIRDLITANANTITTLAAAVGDTNADFVSTYNTAKTA